jgi:hypothetical protein
VHLTVQRETWTQDTTLDIDNLSINKYLLNPVESTAVAGSSLMELSYLESNRRPSEGKGVQPQGAPRLRVKGKTRRGG